MKKPEPSAEHRLLLSTVGTWDFESVCEMGPGQPPMKWSGTETVRAFGEIWTVSEWITPDPALGEHRSLMMLGFDSAQGRFVGNFLSSMSTFLWSYNGRLEPDQLALGRYRLVLDTKGPAFTGTGELVPYQDIFDFIDENTKTLTAQSQNADGEWVPFMRTMFRRRAE